MTEEIKATTNEALPEEGKEVEVAAEEAGTTEALFGKEDDAVDVPEETPKEEIAEPVAKAEEVTTEDKPVAATTGEPKEELITVKVDGVEMQITQAELVKGYQTNKYLTQKGQALAQERKTSANKEVSTPTPTVPVVKDDSFYDDTLKDYIPNLKRDLGVGENNPGELESKIDEMRAIMGPAIYKQGLENVAAHVKSELGQDDFMDYKDTIEAHITSLPIEEWDKYDTVEGMTALYTKFKMTAPIVKAETETPAVKPKTPAIPPSSEGSSGVSGGTNDDSAEKTKIFNKAKETGDWGPYFLKYD